MYQSLGELPSRRNSYYREILFALGFITFILLLLYGQYSSSGTRVNSLLQNFQNGRAERQPTPQSFIERSKNGNITDFFNTCRLPKYDAWEQEVIPLFDPRYNPKRDCKPFEYLTKLENKQLVVTAASMICFGRCLNYKDESSIDYGEWIAVREKPNHEYNCEVVHVFCSHSGTNDLKAAEYEMLHAQFLEKKNISATTNSTKYNVFVLLMDNVGFLHGMRSFPKTMFFLEKSMAGVPFRYINRMADNSPPNAIQLWLGKTAIPLDRTLFGLPSVKEEMSFDDMCVRPLSKEGSLLFKLVKDAGYVTLNLDETPTHTLGYAGCKGFDRLLTDHDILPFGMTRLIPSKSKVAKTYDDPENCLETYLDYLKYLGEFIEAYRGIPKFSWLWLTYATHDYDNGGVPVDTEIYDYLMKHKETIDNSFFIFMADHGHRYGSLLKTKSGAVDVNTPMFVMTVPKALRTNEELMNTIRENAKNLQTHLDTRATILDIVKYQKDFKDFSMMNIPGEHGHSYLRKQPQPRNCLTLPIPIEFCICDYGMEQLNNTNSEIAKRAGSAIIDEVNKILKTENLNNCETWTFNKVQNIFSYTTGNVTNAYKVEALTSHPSKSAIFSAYLRVEKDRIVVGQILRLDAYKKEGDCVALRWRQYCFCTVE